MPAQITRILECLAAVGTLPCAACFVRTHVFNMALEVALISKDFTAFVTCVALVIFRENENDNA